MPHLSRRGFLQALSASTVAATLPSVSLASGAAPPRRVVFILNELGWNPFAFRMKPRGAPDTWLDASGYHPDYHDKPDPRTWELPLADYREEEFSDMLRPLYDLREKVTAIDGLAMASVAADRYGDAHARGFIASLSGHPSGSARSGNQSLGAVPSLDFRIAEHLRARDPSLTDLVNLPLSCSRWGGTPGFFHYFRHASDGAGGTVPVKASSDAFSVLDRLFPPGAERGPTALQRGQLPMLQLVEQRFDAMAGRTFGADRDKLQLHAQLVGDARRRIEALQSITCEPPALGDTSAWWRSRWHDPRWFDWTLDSMLQLMTASLSCGLTRVSSLRITNHWQRDRFGASDYDFHHWYSHGTNPKHRWWTDGERRMGINRGGHEQFVDAAPVLAEKSRVHIEVAARLARMLDAIPEGDGTLLDHTLIVFMDEISHGSHGHDQWPVILIGGFGGAVRTGRYIRLPRVRKNPGINGMPYIGVPHNQLLVSIAQGMGMDIDHLGITEVSREERISLTGPLHELR